MLISLVILIAIILASLVSIVIYVLLRILDMFSMVVQENIILGVLGTVMIGMLILLFLGASYFIVCVGV